MQMNCQAAAIEELKTLCNYDRHSVIIEGPSGCGKSYLANQYGVMLKITEFHIVQPSVSSIREAINTCMITDNPVVLCIENLDTGVAGASYTLLKFFEEPLPNVYIVVTCRNINRVPSTIVSRGVCVTTCSPTIHDIADYARNLDVQMYERIKDNKLFSCANSFHNIDELFKLTDDKLAYIQNLDSLLSSNQPVSDIVWSLNHFTDNTELPIDIVIQYFIKCSKNLHNRQCAIECLNDITEGRIASHTVLTKFVFDMKYTE